MILNCPLPAALTPVTAVTCAFRFDQIVRLLLVRRQAVGSPLFATTAAMKVLANWTTLLATSDSTKIITTPVFAGFKIPDSAPLKQGGNDNTTFKGIAEYYGEGAVQADGVFKNLPAQSKLDMMNLTEESLVGASVQSNLTTYLVNKDGYIFYNDSALNGIPIFNFRIGSAGSNGLNSPNTNGFGFELPPDWDNTINVIKPSFDPITQL